MHSRTSKKRLPFEDLPDQMLYKVMSNQGLHCMIKRYKFFCQYYKNKINTVSDQGLHCLINITRINN